MITIDQDVRQLIRMPLDISNMSEKYVTSNEIFIFQSPSLWTLEKNLFFLLRNSSEKPFNKKYKFKPMDLSFDEYGTINYGQILMYVNGVMSREEFDLDKVVIPTSWALTEIVQDLFPLKDVDSLTRVNL